MDMSLAMVVAGIVIPPLFIFLVPLGFFYVRIQSLFRVCAREVQRLASKSRSPIFQGLDEAITGVASIRAYRNQKYFIAQNLGRVTLAIQLDFSREEVQRWLALRLRIIGTVPVAIVGIFIVVQDSVSSWLPVAISGATAGLALKYSLQLGSSLESLLTSLTTC